MSQVVGFSGGDDFFSGGYLCPYPKESNLLSSVDCHLDVYFPVLKRSRVSTQLLVSQVPKQEPSIEVLPDECLFEVFRRLDGQERSVSACVSKRWLFLLSSIKRNELSDPKTTQAADESETGKADEAVKTKDKVGFTDLNETKSESEECLEVDSCGYLSRCLEGKKATDVRLAAIAVGTASRGGLGKLSIRGNPSTLGLTNSGLRAISHGCPDLGVLSLWNLSSVGDEGLSEIASGCQQLTKIDLCCCPAITDKGLVAVAMNCPNLMSISIESCSSISDEGLQALGRYCRNLKSVTVKNCPLVGDKGIASLFSSAGQTITKANFQALGISDVSLAVIGHYGSAMTELVLGGLQHVNERGFWVMGKGQGLQKLRSLTLISCQGVTDAGLEALANGCPDLKLFSLSKCPFVSDNGVVSLAKASGLLESLKLEECHRITQRGVLGILASSCGKLKSLALNNCLGIRDIDCELRLTVSCQSLRALSIRNCPGLGNVGLAMLGTICTNLTHVDLTGLQGISDAGLLPLVQNAEVGWVKVNLSKCPNLTDNVISQIAELHGDSLETLILDSCRYMTDASLMAVEQNCFALCELDVSGSQITDSGIAILSKACQLNLQILSLAGCSLLTDKCLPFLGLLGNALVGLNIQHCPGISHGAVNLLLENLWRCDILS